MPIYDIFEPRRDEGAEQLELDFDRQRREAERAEQLSKRDRLFSTLVARLFFFLLFIADVAWLLYSLAFFSLSALGMLITYFKIPFFRDTAESFWLSLKRSSVCALSLFLTLFSPAFGIMVACTYFLMYDRDGIEEVVPASLQEQFKEFFK